LDIATLRSMGRVDQSAHFDLKRKPCHKELLVNELEKGVAEVGLLLAKCSSYQQKLNH